MNEPIGQILPESLFGRVLTRLAMNSQTILEIGCWRGGGSTKSLAAGLVRPEQRMWSIDSSAEMIAQARERNPDPRITFLHGTVLRPEECDWSGDSMAKNVSNPAKLIPPLSDPRISLAIRELEECAKLPYIGDAIPEQVDLILLDGGEFTTRFEFLKLRSRCKVIALDDIREDVAWKNFKNHMSIINGQPWHVLFNQPHDRHGWSVFLKVPKRAPGKLSPLCQTPEDVDAVLGGMKAP